MYVIVERKDLNDKIDKIFFKLNNNGNITLSEFKAIIDWKDIIHGSPYHYESIKDTYGWTSDELTRDTITYENIISDPNVVKMIIPYPELLFEDHLNGINDGGERISYGEGKAVREPSNGKGRFDLITPFGLARLARWYELGAKKYSDRNWEKGGIPFSRYTDSALRHIYKYIMGMTDEDHLAAAAWNILCIMHHQELGQIEMDNMPHYLTEKMSCIDKEENKDE